MTVFCVAGRGTTTTTTCALLTATTTIQLTTTTMLAFVVFSKFPSDFSIHVFMY
jgi:hypothetical protein